MEGDEESLRINVRGKDGRLVVMVCAAQLIQLSLSLDLEFWNWNLDLDLDVDVEMLGLGFTLSHFEVLELENWRKK